MKAPPKPSAALGSAVHKQLEEWLRDGKPLDLTTKAGKIALSGIHHLPAPKTPGLVLEGHFGLEIRGVKWQGYKDFGILGPVPLVGDHKTTSDFAWAKSAEDLLVDPAACLYAADAMFRADAQECDLLWVYYRTSGAKASMPVRARVTRDTVTTTLEAMCGRATDRQRIRAAGLRAMDLPPTSSACGAFGGCEYTNLCNLSIGERMASEMEQQAKAADLMARMRERQAGAINPPPVGDTIPAPPPIMSAPPGPPPIPVMDPVTGAWVIPTSEPPAPIMPEPRKRARAVKKDPVLEHAEPAVAVHDTERPEPITEIVEDRDMMFASLCDQLAAALKTLASIYRGA